MKKSQDNQKIHENYVKLTGIDINKNVDKTNESLELEAKKHNENIHKNYIKLLNAGYKTRIIKSADELKYDDLYDDSIQR